MEALTRAMALALGPHGITVNSIAPGWTRTAMTEAYLSEELRLVSNPIRRFGEPEDVGSAAAWLADPSTRQVTGTTIFVDGGQHAVLSGTVPPGTAESG